jgi:hypothetical protein
MTRVELIVLTKMIGLQYALASVVVDYDGRKNKSKSKMMLMQSGNPQKVMGSAFVL